MVRAKELRQQQVTLVGSQTLYKRLDRKLADLEVDPFFYIKQCKLFVWRCQFLQEKTNYRIGEIFFLSARCFDQVLKKLDTTRIYLEERPELNKSIGWEAASKFLTPDSDKTLMFQLHIDKDDGQCECGMCKNIFELFKLRFKQQLESVAFIDLAIQSCSIRSLKTVCIPRMVELGLAQDCLPQSVRENIKNGPELAHVDRRTQRYMDIVERVRNLVMGK